MYECSLERMKDKIKYLEHKNQERNCDVEIDKNR